MQTGWARIVVATLTLAVFYASICSTSCAVGFCPNQQEPSSSHDCEQSTKHHSDHSGNPSPANPDCSKHLHPSLFLIRAGDSQQFPLGITGHLAGSSFNAPSYHRLAVTITTAHAFDSGPPIRESTPLYQRVSVLRV